MRRMFPGVRATAQVFSRATAVRPAMFSLMYQLGRGRPSIGRLTLASPRSAV
jgi:hypothetical protein